MKGISLRKIKNSDLKRMYELFRNDLVLKNLAIQKKAKDITLKDEKNHIKKAIENYNKKQPESFNLAITVNGMYAGNIGAHHIDYGNQKTEIGYWLGQEYWGKGYMPQVVKKFTKILIKKFKLHRIYATPYNYNRASQRVLEKAGFKFEGEEKKSIKKFGKFLDTKVYALVR